MIARTCLLALALLAAYSALLLVPGLTTRFTRQSLWQENIVRGQTYVLAERSPRCVIVGSSLAGRLDPSTLGPDFQNVSLSGGSPLTGLQIIARCAHRPELVVIETNMLMKNEEPDLLANLFRPGIAPLRKHVAAFREQNQPANLVGWALAHGVLQPTLDVLRVSTIPPKTKVSVRDDKLFPLLLARQQRTNDRRPNPTELAKRIERLKTLVAELEARQIPFAFFEMPIDPSLRSAPAVAGVRDALMQQFPKDRYRWILPKEDRGYITTDGVHLVTTESVDFSNYLKGETARWLSPTLGTRS